MIIRRTFLPLRWGIVMTALVFSMSTVARGMGPKPEERPVPYQIMGRQDYHNFLGNWDEKKDPVLYALISTPAQYNTLFHPAAVMGSGGPFFPEESSYATGMILVVARTMHYPESADRVFEVEQIIARNQELSLYYRANQPEPGAKWHGKMYLAIRIPRHDYRKVLFFENGKQIGELNTAAGQWSVPMRTPESK